VVLAPNRNIWRLERARRFLDREARIVSDDLPVVADIDVA
jgi:hypothetical protein